MVLAAMLGAAAVSAQFVAGKAARDALYLASLDVTSLPIMVIAASAFSILLVAIQARVLRHLTPATVVPLLFLLSAALFSIEWLLATTSPRLAAPLVYLHISGLGPMLGSGFWLLASERFDPHTAKRRFGQIAGVGTLGGLAGGLVAGRAGSAFGPGVILPILGLINIVCAVQVRRLARSAHRTAEPEDAPGPAASGWVRMLIEGPYLRNLAAVVFLGTLGPAVLDYLFKAQTVATFGRGDNLVRFFAVYYAGTSLLTFVLQTTAAGPSLRTMGLAASAWTPSLALAGGAVGGLLVPGLPMLVAARGGESVLRGSLYRAAYESFYTPIAPAEKRAAKSVIDVGFDRAAEALGGGLVRVLLLLPLAAQQPVGLAFAAACALVTLVAAARLNRGYVQTLERRLLDRAIEFDLADAHDRTTQTVVLRAMRRLQQTHWTNPSPAGPEVDGGLDPVLADIAALRGPSREQIHAVLDRDSPLPPALVMHVIPLLGRDSVSEACVAALGRVADHHVGLLGDALLDPSQPFKVRRRVARVLSKCTSRRAVDALVAGLQDLRFEVRYHCGRSLAAIRGRADAVEVPRHPVVDAILREVAVSRTVWEGHRVLEASAGDAREPLIDDLVKDRASQSLAHVFTLLSLMLPAEPLRVAFHGLHTDDEYLRGTALEYLDGVLPPTVRDRLWPFLDDRRTEVRQSRDTETVVADLLRSHASIVVNLRGAGPTS